MADIGLRTYLRQIDGLIEQRHLDEAVAHCKHILSRFPKSLAAYRLLGKALLESSRHGDASDVFQRVLSAAPDDFVAHVGMSIVREDEANLQAALWHMERAFEVNPANPAIQEELRRLYGRRDGVMPARARLTRGALARMYVKGGLYPQAEAELRAGLEEDPERLDLSLLLARVLHETNRRPQAADLLTQLLHKLPYSQEGNRLLAQMLREQNRPEDAQVCQLRLEALDPYEAFADGRGSEAVAEDAVRVPQLAPMPSRGAASSEWAGSEWAGVPGAGEPSGAAAEPAAAEPDWLRTGTGALTAEPAAVTAGPDLPAPAPGEVPDWLKDLGPTPAAGSAPDLPDWMKATTGMLAAAAGEGPEPKPTGSLSNWLKPEEAVAPAEAAQPEELPDWLKDFVAPVEPAAAGSSPLTGLAAAEPASPSAETRPARTGPAQPSPVEAGPAAEIPSLSDEDLPEWLKAPAVPTPPGAPAAESAGVPDWLRDLGGELPAPTPDLKPEPSEAVPAAAAEELPDWLRPAAAQGAGEEMPDWLRSALEPPTARPAASPAAAPMPEWLRPPAEPEIEAGPPPAEPALPDWLRAETGARAGEPAPDLASMDAGEAMRWLESLSAEVPAPTEPSLGEAASGQEPAAGAAVPAQTPLAGGQPAPTSAEGQARPEARPAVEPAPSRPAAQGISAAGAEEALRWLESLTARQGAAPEALTTRPDERLERPPAWIAAAASTGPASPQAEVFARPAEPIEEAAAEEPAPEPISEPPDWIRAAAAPPAPAAPAAAPLPKATGPSVEAADARLASLAERLRRQRAERTAAAAERGARPAEAEARAEQPARPAPGTGRLTRTRKTRGKSAYAGQPAEEVLGLSRQRLASGDLAGAAESLGHLIRTGHLVREAIAELEAATAERPSAAVLFTALGDGYMKDNQLQKALEAYRQALARL